MIGTIIKIGIAGALIGTAVHEVTEIAVGHKVIKAMKYNVEHNETQNDDDSLKAIKDFKSVNRIKVMTVIARLASSAWLVYETLGAFVTNPLYAGFVLLYFGVMGFIYRRNTLHNTWYFGMEVGRHDPV